MKYNISYVYKVFTGNFIEILEESELKNVVGGYGDDGIGTPLYGWCCANEDDTCSTVRGTCYILDDCWSLGNYFCCSTSLWPKISVWVM